MDNDTLMQARWDAFMADCAAAAARGKDWDAVGAAWRAEHPDTRFTDLPYMEQVHLIAGLDGFYPDLIDDAVAVFLADDEDLDYDMALPVEAAAQAAANAY